jgi:hypothetical protein
MLLSDYPRRVKRLAYLAALFVQRKVAPPAHPPHLKWLRIVVVVLLGEHVTATLARLLD